MSEDYPNDGAASDQPARRRRSGTLSWLPELLDDETLDPTETLLMIGLADHVNAQDECWVSIETLARYARVSYGTARRRLDALVKAGRIERHRRRREGGNLSTYTWRLVRPADDEPARNLRASKRASGRAVASAHLDARAEPPIVEPPIAKRAASANARTLSLPLSASEQRESEGQTRARDERAIERERADWLLRAWWEARTPRPTQNFVGARKVIERLLSAGWTDEQLARALPSCPVISAKACELALRRTQPAPAPAAPIDDDRGGGDGAWEFVDGEWRLVG